MFKACFNTQAIFVAQFNATFVALKMQLQNPAGKPAVAVQCDLSATSARQNCIELREKNRQCKRTFKLANKYKIMYICCKNDNNISQILIYKSLLRIYLPS